MSENRATKSGIARDTQDKIKGKYNQEVAAQVMAWVARTTGESIDTSGTMESVQAQLSDGFVLCKLANAIKPGCVAATKIKRNTMAFKKMELVSIFNEKMKEAPLSIPDSDVFATTDLYEGQNIVQVITCLEAVGRKCHTAPTNVEGLGPKEASANKREFTEEQLAQGKNIIGLQMGTNKGASQAGQNFGKARHIVD